MPSLTWDSRTIEWYGELYNSFMYVFGLILTSVFEHSVERPNAGTSNPQSHSGYKKQWNWKYVTVLGPTTEAEIGKYILYGSRSASKRLIRIQRCPPTFVCTIFSLFEKGQQGSHSCSWEAQFWNPVRHCFSVCWSLGFPSCGSYRTTKIRDLPTVRVIYEELHIQNLKTSMINADLPGKVVKVSTSS